MKLLCLAVLQTLVLASPCVSFLLPSQAQSTIPSPPTSSPQYVSLPPLHEQAILQDSWTAERLAQVPATLNKYGVDEIVRGGHCFLVAEVSETVFCTAQNDKTLLG